MAKPILVSGIQPSGRLHIGNYLGALKNFVDLQNSGKYDCYFFIADLHALTENPEPEGLKENILNLTADFLAAGLNPKKLLIFQQSQIPAHTELAWIFNTITPVGELERMTQYKDKARAGMSYQEVAMELAEGKINKKLLRAGFATGAEVKKEEIDRLRNVGLFDYPVLMAADILLYGTEAVPVGNDQDQHLELARTLARKFNARFGKVFVEPQPLHTQIPRVMSLDDPTKKMSKSRPAGCLFIDDSSEEIKKKIGRAVTDSGREIKYDQKNKPAISNLLGIYAALSGENIPTCEKHFSGKTYVEFKNELAVLVSEHFADFRKKKKELLAKPAGLKKVLIDGSDRAREVAEKKMAEVKEKIGITV